VSLLILLWAMSPAGWERAIEVPHPGRVAVVLDRIVYAAAEPDLHDVRVVDEQGRLVSFILDRATTVAQARLEAATINHEFETGRSESLTLDFGRAVRKEALVLSLSGDDFRRRVSVAGSDDGRAFTTLTDDAYVFAVPGEPAARFESVRLPENDRRYLRVTVYRGEGDRERPRILSVVALAGPKRLAQTEAFTPRVSRFEDPERRESQFVLDLGVRAQPFEEIRLGVGEASFFRDVVVEARRDDVAPRREGEARGTRWVRLGEAAVYQYVENGQPRKQTAIVLCGRERALRLRVRNRDDRPLGIGSITVLVPLERVLFEALSGHAYRLRYGGSPVGAPEFDLEHTTGGAASFGASAFEARLGEPLPLPEGADERPWTERHPRLLWLGLLVVVAGLALVTLRALRSA
jgi:Protein of unknown function (DUF3999)